MTTERREREVLNMLATMPERSSATILGVRVERFLLAYFVGGVGHVLHPREAAKVIVRLAAERSAAPEE
jgi:hypothetical protein